ncbi:MAG: hypothetical protein JXB15_05400 [Anaerolineales bacterium]|nr:hypothetical protein [Anaerolineales bacterium]
MKVFIVIRLPRDDPRREDLAALAAKTTRQAGHIPFVAYQEILRAGITLPSEFMPFVRREIAGAQLMLILYDTELRGGLIEEGIAYAFGVPVWLAHQAGERVSSSALGCASRVIAYQEGQDLEEQLLNAYRGWMIPARA